MDADEHGLKRTLGRLRREKITGGMDAFLKEKNFGQDLLD